jgi:hypothetical protein
VAAHPPCAGVPGNCSSPSLVSRSGGRRSLRLESREDFVSISRHEAVLYLRHEDELFVFVNAHEQGIETERTGNATANDELLLSIRAVVDRRS